MLVHPGPEEMVVCLNTDRLSCVGVFHTGNNEPSLLYLPIFPRLSNGAADIGLCFGSQLKEIRAGKHAYNCLQVEEQAGLHAHQMFKKLLLILFQFISNFVPENEIRGKHFVQCKALRRPDSK